MPSRVKDLLVRGRDLLGRDKLPEIEILMGDILSVERAKLILEFERELSKEQVEEFLGKLEKLDEDYPIQYLTGKKDFMDLEFMVNENVLIPRYDTEILVEKVIEEYSQYREAGTGEELSILDLCTGSGVIGISLAYYLKGARVTCVDISEGALEVAKANKEKILGPDDQRVSFVKSDLFENLAEKSFDIIVSNPPYISYQEYELLDENVKQEPELALTAPEEGSFFYRKILENASKHLKADGEIFFEIGYTQASKIKELAENNGFSLVEIIKDYAKLDRVLRIK